MEGRVREADDGGPGLERQIDGGPGLERQIDGRL